MNGIKMECISIRPLFPEQIKIGKEYRIDKNSIFESKGTTYVAVYDGDKYVGILNLNHFKSID